MTPILNWFSHEEARCLAEALLHSLWQGALLSFLLYAALRTVPSRCPNTRYLVSLGALLAMVMGVFLTASFLNFEPPRTLLTNQAAPPPATWGESVRQALRSSSTLLSSAGAAVSTRPGSQTGPALPWQAWFLTVWTVGAIAMLIRLSLRVASVQEIRRCSRPCSDETVLALVESLRRTLRISRRIGVAVSEAVSSPAVLGVLQPTLLLPLAVVTGLPVDALRAVLLHELAHIRRRDYLVNLLQMLIEALVFFNPAVWWINRQIRLEREACCDALAVRHTGDGAEYVTAILHALEVVQPKDFQPALQNLAEESEPSQLVERVRRILQPSHSQKPRLSLLHFASLLILCLFLIACMREGADIAVETASKWFISDEQMQQLVEVEKAYDPLPNETAGEGTTITVSGTVRTEDGSPLPERLTINSHSFLEMGSNGGSAEIEDGTFTATVPFGEVYLLVRAPEYATLSYGPFVAEPSGTVSGIETVLTKGHDATIQFTDPQGQSLQNVKAHGYAMFEYKRSSMGHDSYDLASDDQGKITVRHIGNLRHRIEATAEGYQMDERNIALKPDEPYVWVLHPARPTAGVITSKVTGSPIAGAELKIVKEQTGSHTKGRELESAEAVAVTGSDGRFTLTTLRDDTAYTFIVEAPDHHLAVLPSVRDNQTGIEVALGPRIVVQGTVTGGVERLPAHSQVASGNTFPHENQDIYNNEQYPLEIQDGVGHFSIDRLFPGRLVLRVADQRVEMPIEQSISNVEIRIPTETAELPTRPVVLRMDTPEHGAPPKGSILIRIYQEISPHTNEQTGQRILPIQDGEVRTDLPVGFNISYEPVDIIGYWFKSQSPIPVESGSRPMEVLIPAIPTGSAYGRVMKADGSPAVGVTLHKVTLKTSPLESQLEGYSYGIIDQPMTAPDGTFHVPNLPLAGTYVISAKQGNKIVSGPPFTLTDDKITQELNLTLPEGATLEGYVVDEQSRVVPHLELTLIHDNSSWQMETQTTNTDGSFVFTNLNPDSEHYFIGVFSKRDYRPVRQKVVFSRNPMKIQLEKGHVLTGVVLDQYTKKPIPGVELQAGATDESHKDFAHSIQAETPTNKKGEFRFSNMSPVEYRFYLQGVNSPYEFTAKGGDPNPITIHATIPEWSRLKARAAEE